MFGRLVKIDSKEYFVSCGPVTPHSEILMRAARMAEREEMERQKAQHDHIAYRRMLNLVRASSEW